MRLLVCIEQRRVRQRVIDDVPRIGETLEELLDRSACRWTGDCATQETNRSAITTNVRELSLDLVVNFGPGGFLSFFQRVLQPL